MYGYCVVLDEQEPKQRFKMFLIGDLGNGSPPRHKLDARYSGHT